MVSALKFAFIQIFISLYFKGLLANECDFNVKLKQNLHNEGFHRNMSYDIMFETESLDSRKLYTNCFLGVDQTLPSGVFVNPDEITDLIRQNKLNVVPKNPVNVELAAEMATPDTVYLFSPVSSDAVVVWMPVHARYHRVVSGGGMARNTIEQPTLYLRCPDKRLDACQFGDSVQLRCSADTKEQCDWKRIPYFSLTDTIIWKVPVGDFDYHYTITVGTFTVIGVSSMYLLRIIHEYKMQNRQNQ